MDILLELRNKIRHPATRVVFPEGEEDLIIRAAAQVMAQGIATPILIGSEQIITDLATSNDLRLKGIGIIDIQSSPKLETYVSEYCRDRDFPAGAARIILSKPQYFAAMMVKMNDADAMVGGIATATEEIVMASELLIGMQPEISTPSSYFLMDIPDYQGSQGSLLIFADAAINPNPTPEQLADIAIASARSANELLNWEPKIAMLSFSTKGSATHPDVDKVIEAISIAREKEPGLNIDGELQADTAIVPEVAKRKIKEDSSIAGKANILIFPDLDAGNIAYKLVQRLAKASAYGPFLQGFAKPVSDLSRGATIDDVIGAITIVVVKVQSYENPSN
jgi:phosphate acetyltransferase